MTALDVRAVTMTPTANFVEGNNADELLAGLALVVSRNSNIVDRRGGAVREIPGVTTLTLRNVAERLPLLPARRLNPWVTLAEFPWIMAGRCDVGWLLPYLPRAAEFSDDGRYWRAGYGPRLRKWGAQSMRPVTLDQVARVVGMLREDPTTRQAVISIWDPEVDLGAKTKDMPCTNWLHFQAEGDRLNLTVVMRSNDMIWGFSGVNMVNFTLLLELVATCAGLRVGRYQHVSTNMHMYRRHWHMLSSLMGGMNAYESMSTEAKASLRSSMPTELHDFSARCHMALTALESYRQPGDRGPLPLLPSSWGNDWIGEWAYFMSLHSWLGREGCDAEWWAEALGYVRNRAWALAAAGYLAQREPLRYDEVAYAVSSRVFRSATAREEWLREVTVKGVMVDNG